LATSIFKDVETKAFFEKSAKKLSNELYLFKSAKQFPRLPPIV
jgi:hypothetical protein